MRSFIMLVRITQQQLHTEKTSNSTGLFVHLYIVCVITSTHQKIKRLEKSERK